MDNEASLSEFSRVTGASREKAQQYLTDNNDQLFEAIDSYYDDMEGGDDGGNPQSSGQPSQGASNATNQQTASSASKKKPTPQKKKFGTLSDLQSNAESHDDDSDKEQEFYAGGDKSGLAVQDPSQQGGGRDSVQRLIDTARRNGPPPPPREEPAGRSTFRGAATTLGGDDAPSRRIADPNAEAAPPRRMETRILHLWLDGFSIDDGPLHRYDDPANARALDQINHGQAPIELLNVGQGDAVDVKLDPHRDQNYVAPKKTAKAFAGSGTRLGSPTPGPSGSSTTPVESSTATTQPSTSPNPNVNVDDSQPVITLQVRLADGTRLPSRFNTSHTVEDVYSFVRSASPASAQRAFTLATTFPTKELTDKSQKLGDMAEFKRGGVVIQKWQ
ncbi:MAG: hypothetical protein M1828_002050 [Chrysothrix sp. TS-e1954]|nr:MAG: hypothetical protein M1828_002050 [Chrysothrix sp. TS-e1954]